MKYQRTIADKLEIIGEGIFTGKLIKVELIPADENTGIIFIRADLPSSPQILLSPNNVIGLNGNTAITDGNNFIYLIEHLLSALHGLSIDNLKIKVYGCEIPILDGSAKPWVKAIQKVGYKFLPAPKKILKLKKAIEVRNGKGYIKFFPGDELQIKSRINFSHPYIKSQYHEFVLGTHRYIKDICFAKTFAFKDDLLQRQKLGIIKGGDINSVIILDKKGILNPEVMSVKDEFARHKVLDLIGDLYTLGGTLLARVEACCSSHKLHIEAVKRLYQERNVLELIEPLPSVTFVLLSSRALRK